MRRANRRTIIVASLLGILQPACNGSDVPVDRPTYLLPVHEIRRISAMPNPGADPQFRNISVMTLDDAGRIIVAGRALQVQVFPYSGYQLPMRAFGGRGTSRGKFASIARLMVHADTVAVFDASLSRITRFDSLGAVVGVDQITSPDNTHAVPYALVDGGWIVRVMHSKPHALGLHRDTMTLRRVATIAEAFTMAPGWDTATVPTQPVRVPTEWAMYESDHVSTPLFTAHPDVGVDARGRMYVSDGQKYEISVYDVDGKLIRRISRNHTPVAITRSMVDHYLEGASESERAREKIAREKTLPALGQLLVSRTGDVWVERPDLSIDPSTLEHRDAVPPARYYDLFDPNGAFRGTILTAPGFTPRAVMGRTIMGTLRDRKNSEFIVGYSVTY